MKMRNYIIGRLIRSVISIFLVVTLAIILIYTMVPRNNVFQNDPMISKLAAKPDERVRYKHDAWEKLGYIDFHELREMCVNAGLDGDACMLITTEETVVDGETVSKVVLPSEAEKAKEYYEAEGWTVEKYQISGLYYAYRDRSVLSIVTGWFTNLVQIDNPWRVNDALNPELERKIYLEADHNGVPALKCSGCDNKYSIAQPLFIIFNNKKALIIEYYFIFIRSIVFYVYICGNLRLCYVCDFSV